MDDQRTVVLGEPTAVGRWCPTCLRPTGYEQEILALSASGIEVVGSAHGCTSSEDPVHWPSPLPVGA